MDYSIFPSSSYMLLWTSSASQALFRKPDETQALKSQNYFLSEECSS